jgi:hypothetical protein
MLILDASRRARPVRPLARWCLGAGIAATIGANLAHGLDHGPSARWSAPGLPWHMAGSSQRAIARELGIDAARSSASSTAPPDPDSPTTSPTQRPDMHDMRVIFIRILAG